MKSYRQRLAFVTTTPGSFPAFFRHAYQPFVITMTFPAVAFCALSYGASLAWFSILATTEATYFVLEPYNFTSIGVGLLAIPAFIGGVAGALYGGILSDWSIVWFTKRNGGIYEPEMRLYLVIFPAFVGPAGLFLYGYSTSEVDILFLATKLRAPLMPRLGNALDCPLYRICHGWFHNFSHWGSKLDLRLRQLSRGALLQPPIHTPVVLLHRKLTILQILGDALVGVAFIRNIFATIILFTLTQWTEALGFYNLFTCVGCIALGLNLTVVPMIIWGKKWRLLCAKRYQAMADRQFDARAI
jgi:hypothetical protein